MTRKIHSVFVGSALTCAGALAGYEAPNAAYNPPASYYNGATSTSGTTLKSQLNAIINNGFSSQSYDSVRDAYATLDADPARPGNILLVYNRASVDATWDSGTTYNREHLWVDSRLPASANGDYFNLRPSNPDINNVRGNLNFGTAATTGGHGVAGDYYFAGDSDKGDVARSLFYMASKWSGLTLVNGNPTATNQMGDLQALLRWHYQDGVDNFERRRNHLIYNNYQRNRNPYIDRPEYVWAVFGGGNNNSQLSVGTPAADGSSSASVNLGRVLVGATLGTGSATLSKTGTHPTTYNIAASGAATTTSVGVGQTMDYDLRTRVIPLGLNASTATAGRKSGSVVITNTDLTSGSTGRGSADGQDTISVYADVLAHANPSFSAGSDINSLTLDFGQVRLGDAVPVRTISIYNLESAASFTAGLDLDLIATTGDSSRIVAGLDAFSNLASGSSRSFSVSLNTSALGLYSATYTLQFSDENLPGALSLGSMVITATGEIVPVPEPASVTAATLLLAVLLNGRQRAS